MGKKNFLFLLCVYCFGFLLLGCQTYEDQIRKEERDRIELERKELERKQAEEKRLIELGKIEAQKEKLEEQSCTIMYQCFVGGVHSDGNGCTEVAKRIMLEYHRKLSSDKVIKLAVLCNEICVKANDITETPSYPLFKSELCK